MRTETTTRNIYTFDELSEEAKDKARQWWIEASCVDEWWEYIYDDAEQIGLKITEFDLNGNRHATGHFTLSAEEVASNINRNHGETCETFKSAGAFLKDHDPEFLKSLLEDYSIMLQKEYEWYFGTEHAEECIRINDYEFTADGEIA